MARIPRAQVGGEWHHIMNRGARRLPIFGDDDDRRYFLHLVGESAEKLSAEIHAYALMGNHYHLLIRAEVPQLSGCMKTVGELFTRWFNDKYHLDGSLFRGRFRSKPVLEDRYLQTVLRYIHRNPIDDSRGPADWTYPWSSHPAYCGDSPPPRWLRVEPLRSQFGDVDDYKQFVEGSITRKKVPAAPPQLGLETPTAVEWALGVASEDERLVLAAGGRGIRNHLRVACVLLCMENTRWTADAIASRYGYRSAAQVRTAASRARQRAEVDGAFAAELDEARARLAIRGSRAA